MCDCHSVSFKYCVCQHYRSRNDTYAQRFDRLRSDRYRDILDLWSLHPHKTSTKNSVRSVSIIKQITTLSTVAKPIHILFLHCIYCNITFPWLNPLIEIHSFIKTSKLYIIKKSVKNRTVCSNLNIHHTSVTPKILPQLWKIKNVYSKTVQKESEPFDIVVKHVKSCTTDKVSVMHRTNQQAL